MIKASSQVKFTNYKYYMEDEHTLNCIETKQ